MSKYDFIKAAMSPEIPRAERTGFLENLSKTNSPETRGGALRPPGILSPGPQRGPGTERVYNLFSFKSEKKFFNYLFLKTLLTVSPREGIN
jgi:hypothetical protein